MPSREEALALLEQWVENPGLRNHMRSVEAAVLLHGGEASGVRAAFQALTPQQRAALLAYVESL